MTSPQALCPSWVSAWTACGSRRRWWLPAASRPRSGPWWRPWGRWSWVRASPELEVGGSCSCWRESPGSRRWSCRSSTTPRWEPLCQLWPKIMEHITHEYQHLIDFYCTINPFMIIALKGLELFCTYHFPVKVFLCFIDVTQSTLSCSSCMKCAI